MYAHKQHFQDEGSLRDKAKNKTNKKTEKIKKSQTKLKDV